MVAFSTAECRLTSSMSHRDWPVLFIRISLGQPFFYQSIITDRRLLNLIVRLCLSTRKKKRRKTRGLRTLSIVYGDSVASSCILHEARLSFSLWPHPRTFLISFISLPIYSPWFFQIRYVNYEYNIVLCSQHLRANNLNAFFPLSLLEGLLIYNLLNEIRVV